MKSTKIHIFPTLSFIFLLMLLLGTSCGIRTGNPGDSGGENIEKGEVYNLFDDKHLPFWDKKEFQHGFGDAPGLFKTFTSVPGSFDYGTDTPVTKFEESNFNSVFLPGAHLKDYQVTVQHIRTVGGAVSVNVYSGRAEGIDASLRMVQYDHVGGMQNLYAGPRPDPIHLDSACTGGRYDTGKYIEPGVWVTIIVRALTFASYTLHMSKVFESGTPIPDEWDSYCRDYRPNRRTHGAPGIAFGMNVPLSKDAIGIRKYRDYRLLVFDGPPEDYADGH